MGLIYLAQQQFGTGVFKTMVEFVFRRSSRHSNICDEMANLSRLKLEDAIKKTEQTQREQAIGAIIGDNEVKFTETIEGEVNTVRINQVMAVYSKLESSDKNGRKILIHTHSSKTTPSSSDIQTILASMTGENIKPNIDIPNFDGFFILGKENPQKGKMKGINIKRQLTDEEYSELNNEFVFSIGSIDSTGTEQKRERWKVFKDVFGDFLSVCNSTFKIRGPR